MLSENTALNPDRLLPAWQPAQKIARDLYEEVKDAPIISPHAHVPASWYRNDLYFASPTELFITPDHYVTRFLHSQGVALESLGVKKEKSGEGPYLHAQLQGEHPSELSASQARAAWQALGHNWLAFAGTPMGYWLQDSLVRVFGITEPMNEANADRIYDELMEKLRDPRFTTKELTKRFGMELISTTASPVDELTDEKALNADPELHAHVAPAFRPDAFLEPAAPGWAHLVDQLAQVAGTSTGTYEGFFEAMKRRRAYFKQAGALLSDHSHASIAMRHLPDEQIRDLFAQAYQASSQGKPVAISVANPLRAHLLMDQAQLAQEDGLVMTVHPSVYRNYDAPVFAQFGPDAGDDLPARAEFSEALQPMLTQYGHNPDFHFVAFTIDETVFSRELAPLAGFYPSMFVGAPWWFLDSPEAIGRYFAATVPYAGFANLSGFIDDTRALCSIPSRHDMNRRLTAGYIATLVAQGQVSITDAHALLQMAVIDQPRRVFKTQA